MVVKFFFLKPNELGFPSCYVICTFLVFIASEID